MNLNKYQASVLALLFEKLPIEQYVDYIDFALRGENGERHFVAHAQIIAEENTVNVIFTLPLNSTKVFLALTELKTKEVARLLANIEEYENENGLSLGSGEVVVTPDLQEPIADFPYAIIVMPVETSKDCASLPSSKEIAGRPIITVAFASDL